MGFDIEDKRNQELLADSLSMIVLPKLEWMKVINELKEIKEVLKKKSEEEVNSQWIESVEARKMLGVSHKTWQTYRDERRIPFSQFGRKIYVKRADLEAFMEKHYIKASNKLQITKGKNKYYNVL